MHSKNDFKNWAGLHLWAQDQYFLFANLLNEMGLSKDEVNDKTI